MKKSEKKLQVDQLAKIFVLGLDWISYLQGIIDLQRAYFCSYV